MTRPRRTITSIVAFTSADVIRKFTMHARSAKLPSITALDRYAVPSACNSGKQRGVQRR